jgi:hypothetical protein
MATHTPTTQTNKQYTLNYRDVLRGLLIAVLTAVTTTIYEAITQPGGFDAIEWKEVGAIGVAAGLSYLLKNFFTPTEIVVVNPPQQALTAIHEGAPIKVGTTTVAAKGATDPQAS